MTLGYRLSNALQVPQSTSVSSVWHRRLRLVGLAFLCVGSTLGCWAVGLVAATVCVSSSSSHPWLISVCVALKGARFFFWVVDIDIFLTRIPGFSFGSQLLVLAHWSWLKSASHPLLPTFKLLSRLLLPFFSFLLSLSVFLLHFFLIITIHQYCRLVLKFVLVAFH